jgi:hypothetical protein
VCGCAYLDLPRTGGHSDVRLSPRGGSPYGEAGGGYGVRGAFEERYWDRRADAAPYNRVRYRFALDPVYACESPERIASIRACSENGLRRNATAPAVSACRRATGSSCALMKIVGSSRFAATSSR